MDFLNTTGVRLPASIVRVLLNGGDTSFGRGYRWVLKDNIRRAIAETGRPSVGAHIDRAIEYLLGNYGRRPVTRLDRQDNRPAAHPPQVVPRPAVVPQIDQALQDNLDLGDDVLNWGGGLDYPTPEGDMARTLNDLENISDSEHDTEESDFDVDQYLEDHIDPPWFDQEGNFNREVYLEYLRRLNLP
jgi:hypothetical protein